MEDWVFALQLCGAVFVIDNEAYVIDLSSRPRRQAVRKEVFVVRKS